MSTLTLSEAIANGRGIERSFCCPVHGDTHPSASVNTLKGVWFCYTCGARGKAEGEDLLSEPDYDLVRRQLLRQCQPDQLLDESWLSLYASDNSYWLSRGFSEEACHHFHLGFDYQLNAATYPLRDNIGNLLGVVRRSLASGPKYKYPYGIDISELLFNYHSVDAGVLVLVEGATDAIAAWDVGVQACALYGSRLSAAQAGLIRQYDPEGIICAFDADAAGYGAYRAVCQALPQYRIARAEWSSGDGKDLNDLKLKTRKEILLKGLDLFR